MEQTTLRQLHGAADLIVETVDATVVAIAAAHQDITCQPYALLALIPAIAIPAHAIGQVQLAITDHVYHTIRAVNRLAGAAAMQALDQLHKS